MRPLGGIDIQYSTSKHLQPDSCWVNLSKWPVVTVASSNKMNSKQIVAAISRALNVAETHKTDAWLDLQAKERNFAEDLADILKILENLNA